MRILYIDEYFGVCEACMCWAKCMNKWMHIGFWNAYRKLLAVGCLRKWCKQLGTATLSWINNVYALWQRLMEPIINMPIFPYLKSIWISVLTMLLTWFHFSLPSCFFSSFRFNVFRSEIWLRKVMHLKLNAADAREGKTKVKKIHVLNYAKYSLVSR